MDISIVIPLYNEDESLPELFRWIKQVMESHGFSYEVIFVNDGSTDRSWEVIEGLKAENPETVHGIKFRRNYGKSPALYCGFGAAQGDVVITMDADLQDSPDEIPELYRMITQDGYDLVSGYKMNRSKGDPLSKTIPTKLFNATARQVSGIHNLHDFNCGLKAYRKEVIKNIEVYGEMHRYIPYLAKNAGFTRIGEKRVHHQARKFGKSKFMGLNRFVNGYLDLLSLWFLDSFGLKPMHVFGFIGTLMLWPHSRNDSRRHQTLLHHERHPPPPRDQQPILLYRTHHDDTGHTALRGRLPGRAHQPKRTGAQQLSD